MAPQGDESSCASVDGRDRSEAWEESSNTSRDTHSSDDRDRRFKRNEKRAKVGDEAARHAAACGGLFVNVEYPWIRNAYYTDYGLVAVYQKESPYYFQGQTKALPDGTKTKDVFLKVWKVGEVAEKDVQREWANHRRAYQAGVPVAAPVLDEVFRSTSLSGSKYLVFAVERLSMKPIKNAKDLLQFSASLIEAVKKLHDDAGLLHGDLKPGNIRWSDGVVRIIDFGNSREINKAVRARGTQGYEAPEVLMRMPCSTKTDAFSVGAIILEEWKHLDEENRKSEQCCALHEMVMKLTDSSPATRWSIAQALEEIQKIRSG